MTTEPKQAMPSGDVLRALSDVREKYIAMSKATQGKPPAVPSRVFR